jgi:hypothetical protein
METVAIPRELLEELAPELPMSQDEMGGCVWCAGPFGKRSGEHAGPSPSDHAKDCPWLLARKLLKETQDG